MCLWAKVPSPTSGNKQLLHIGKGSGWANNRFTILYQGSTTVSRIVTSISDGSSYGAYSCYTDIPIDTWIHIASVFDNKKLKLYINGELKNTYNTTYDLSFNSIEALGIGGAPNGAELLKSGYINDVRIYDHALSPLEVKQISQGLILHYPLNRNGWGQENLLLNTQVLTPNSSTTTKNCSQRGSAVRQLRIDGFYEAKCTSAWQGLSTWANAQNLIVGQKYTYSFYFYTDGSIKSLSFYPMMFNSSGTRDTSSTLLISVDGSGYQSVNSRTFGNFSNSTPIKHYITFEWNNTMASIISNGGTIELSIQVHGTFNSGEYGCVYAPKLEVGDKMTSWCPNSSDALATTMGLNNNIQYDTSGYGNNGIKKGAFSYDSDTPKYNVSTIFNGSNTCIYLNNFILGNQWSYGMWFFHQTRNIGWTIITILNNTGSDSDTQFSFWYHNNESRLQSTANTQYNSSIPTPTKDAWHHFFATFDGNILTTYIDGVIVNTKTITAELTQKPHLTIGGRRSGENSWDYYWKGKMSDYRVYCTALSADDVKSLYNNSAYIDNQGNIYGAVYEEV